MEATEPQTPQLNSSKPSILTKVSENSNPNHKHVLISKSGLKSKLIKSGGKNNNPGGNLQLVKSRIREGKFVVAKKSKRVVGNMGCKCSNGDDGKVVKCLCVAYQSLRASQEGFFRNGSDFDGMRELNLGREDEGLIEKGGIGEELGEKVEEYGDVVGIGDDKIEGLIENGGIGEGLGEKVEECGDDGGIGEMGFLAMKRSRERLLEEARESVSEPGSGRVMHLVKAFESMKIFSMLKSSGLKDNGEKEGEGKCLKWALPGLQVPARDVETQSSSSSFCPFDLFLTSECLGLDSRVSSLASYQGLNSSDSSLTFVRRQRRNKKQLKTTAKPFKLRTEERGKRKEEEFIKKVQQLMEEEERLRVPIAQGLPWTTEEPECLVKPPIKESTKPIDLVLHSDVRAEERAEFDHQVAEKMSLIEQYKAEKERHQKLAEEEEIRRLRKELVPKAQPMPYFDRPFIPRRSEKPPTIPKEPKLHIPQHKKIKCTQQSWSDTSSYISSSDICYGL